MKQLNGRFAIALAMASAVTLGGCQTTGDVQQQMAGVGIGAVVGCGVGALVTGSARGCAAGAAIGGALGFGVVAYNQYEARQVRSSSKDRRVYGLTKSVSSTQVRINKGTNSPRSVRAGQTVDIMTDYSVRLPSNKSSVNVTESWVLMKDGQQDIKLPAKTNKRFDGGWQADAEITIPAGVEPGNYVIEHRVQAGSSYDTDRSKFKIKG